MEHIIATTDLSVNSKAGMRFAIQLAEARNAKLTFLHIHTVLRASFWSDDQYNAYIRKSKETIMRELPAFVKSVCRSMKVNAENYEMAVYHNLDTVDGILTYASKLNAAYIVTSTRGAGTLKRIIGTHTGKLISKSSIPILCIPSSYRLKPITSILYATDMANYESEATQVVAFARPLNAAIDMLHFSFPYEFIIDKELMEKTLKQKTGYEIAIRYQSRDIEKSLLKELNIAIKNSKPSVLAMFTDQGRSFYEQLFLSSQAKEFAFHPKLPLLSFNKAKSPAVNRVNSKKKQLTIT